MIKKGTKLATIDDGQMGVSTSDEFMDGGRRYIYWTCEADPKGVKLPLDFFDTESPWAKQQGHLSRFIPAILKKRR